MTAKQKFLYEFKCQYRLIFKTFFKIMNASIKSNHYTGNEFDIQHSSTTCLLFLSELVHLLLEKDKFFDQHHH